MGSHAVKVYICAFLCFSVFPAVLILNVPALEWHPQAKVSLGVFLPWCGFPHSCRSVASPAWVASTCSLSGVSLLLCGSRGRSPSGCLHLAWSTSSPECISIVSQPVQLPLALLNLHVVLGAVGCLCWFQSQVNWL